MGEVSGKICFVLVPCTGCVCLGILGNPGVTHSVSTAFMMNAVGTEWVTPGLSSVTHSVSTAFMMNAVGTEWVTPGLPRMVFRWNWCCIYMYTVV